MNGVPNPGSTQAYEQGCTCPMFDNCHGRFAPFPATDTQPEGWYISMDCPLHMANPIRSDPEYRA